ncbi:MAG TPA: type 1 glutamine amidotransferase domain-containing protein [Candidatus Dormibacteraeota bacterium]|nr:type 1 glutamine amidotransferase domain-containing protein [Candidatus Dormibacteraeota bacterium]
MPDLNGLKVAILATDGFEQVELTEPRKALDESGARTSVVSPKSKGEEIRGWKFKDWGESVKVDESLDQARPEDYDALLLPGGVMNPDKLRMNPKAVAFIKSFFDSKKPVAATCHGPWTIIEAGAAKGRRIASWPSVKTDLRNASAEWVNSEAVTDVNLVSARKPDDIPAFNRAMLELFSSGRQQQQRAAGR